MSGGKTHIGRLAERRIQVILETETKKGKTQAKRMTQREREGGGVMWPTQASESAERKKKKFNNEAKRLYLFLKRTVTVKM